MMIEKIEARSTDNYYLYKKGVLGPEHISRVTGFLIDFEHFMKWPFGYGFVERSGKYESLGVSSNGLMRILVMWEILGAILMITAINRMFKKLFLPHF